MPVEVDPPAKISWDERNDWAEVFAHFVDSGRTDFKPISTTTRGLVGIIITRYNLVLTTDFAGYTTVDPLPILIGLWNKEAHLRALLHRWLSVFSASFAFSCTVPDRLSPRPCELLRWCLTTSFCIISSCLQTYAAHCTITHLYHFTSTTPYLLIRVFITNGPLQVIIPYV